MSKGVKTREHLKKFNKEYYAEFYEKKIPRIKYPDERVVSYLFQEFKERKGLKCLDLGCGTGRHSILMAREGCKVNAIDISEKAVTLAGSWAKEEGLDGSISFQTCNAVSLPFQSGYFDFVLESSALEHNTNEDMILILKEVYRVLKKGGKLLSIVPGREHYLYGSGYYIEPGAFTADADRYKGSGLTHFFTQEEIYSLFSQAGFEKLEVNFNLTTVDNCTKKISYWYIETEKE